MVNGLYTVFDVVVQEYGPIVMLKNDGVALRWFNIQTKDIPDHMKGDYSLKRVGSFDSESGDIEREDVREVVIPREDK